MLETKNLRKVYRTKKGVSVTALDDVSLKFPDKGMVFLLGKSGSGKSTLLNLLGGLDKYDDGEIIIKGVSSKDFRQNHFDSYRNTYVGFIFQEYNVLEDFTVGANIALAIELQGRKAKDEEINNILEKVDLVGFGERKPNELSGGQKQRVAIARALVKNPHIIMADEPTGALDSATGKQVLDTLKSLSRDKLVIVVSHDREFAENYADRIIELADGNVINDVERASSISAEDIAAAIQFEKDTMLIPAGYHLTEDDRIRINEYIDSLGSNLKGTVKKSKNRKFAATDQSQIKHGTGDFKLIKSRLPLKNALKIGASGLTHKKIRLAITILLSFAAFSLFGLADTMGNYDHVKTCTNSIVDSKIQYASASKSVKAYSGVNEYWDDWSQKLSDKDIAKMSKDTGLDFKGIYVPSDELPLTNYDTEVKLADNEESNFYITNFSGFVEMTEKDLTSMSYKLVAGKMPDGNKDEAAISSFMYETYAKSGYIPTGKDAKSKIAISDYNDMIGKEISVGKTKLKITGIVDTKVDLDRYSKIKESPLKQTTAEKLANYALSQELDCIQSYSLASALMTGNGYVQKVIDKNIHTTPLGQDGLNFNGSNEQYFFSDKITKLSELKNVNIKWLGDEKQSLGEKEVIVTTGSYYEGENKLTADEIIENIKKGNEFSLYVSGSNDDDSDSAKGWKIVGVIDSKDIKDKGDLSTMIVMSDKNVQKFGKGATGDYRYAVSNMPSSTKDINNLVKYFYKDSKSDYKYKLQNSVTYELDTVNDVLKVLSKVFMYIGIGFAAFAALMLANFIASSISYKKQEIGILRAIGSRSSDVFKIFFSESLIIAMINFVLACIGTGVATAVINWVIRTKGQILITILNFGPRQIVLLLIISIGVSAISSFIPVYRTARKRPIEAIRNK